MSEGSNSLWTSYKEMVENTRSPQELVESFGEQLWTTTSNYTTVVPSGTVVTTGNSTNIGSSSTNPTNVGQTTWPNVLQWSGGSSPSWYPVESESVELESAPVELSAESMEQLKRVEEKLDALLGKHPFARMANLRKALDEILAELNNDARYEGVKRKILPNGLTGWEAEYSYALPSSGRMYVKSGIMPTENEAIAQLIRMSQGEV